MPPIANALTDTGICSFSVRFFWCFRFFCYCIFLFVLLLEQGYFNVTLLPMQPVGWGYPPPSCSTANNGCGGHSSWCDTATTATCSCKPGTAAAVHDAVEHAATGSCRAHYCFRCACYAPVVRATRLAVRTTQVLVARALSCFPQTLSQTLTQFSPTQPLWPAPQSPLRSSCLTAAVSHAVPQWFAHLGLPSARQSSSGPSAASALRPTASAAAAANAAAASAGYGPASRRQPTTPAAAAAAASPTKTAACGHCKVEE